MPKKSLDDLPETFVSMRTTTEIASRGAKTVRLAIDQRFQGAIS